MRMAGIPPSYEALQDLAQEKFSSVREKIPPLVLSRGVCDEMFYVLTSLFRRKDRPKTLEISGIDNLLACLAGKDYDDSPDLVMFLYHVGIRIPWGTLDSNSMPNAEIMTPESVKFVLSF